MTNAYTPQENSVSERMNHTLVEMARVMLFDAGLPNAYWGDAILYATHVLNRVPTHVIADGLTPHEAFTGNRPSVVHLRTFECKVHVHVPDEKRWKLDAKSVECTFLGFAENRKAYVCVHRPSGHIFESRDVVFDEGRANTPSRVKIDDPCLNVERTKLLVVGTLSEAVQMIPDSPVGDGETASANEDSDGESVNRTPSERVSDVENALIHAPVSSDRSGSPPDGVLSRQLTRVEVAVERQVSRGQRQGKQPERTSDGHSGHPFAPPSPYPVPIPTPAVRRSSHARRAPICDDDSRFFVNAYERTTLEEEIQLNDEGTDDLPRRIEGLDAGGEMHACTDIVGCDESHCDTLTQSAHHAATATPLDSEPLTYSDAVSCPDANLWLGAMGVKLNTFKEIGLYQEVETPPDRKIIDSKWVFKIKRGPNGEIDKYKARLVTKGYTQIEGLDYMDTFAPVTKFTTIRSLLALAAQHNLEVHQVDVKAAFLNGELEEEIYLRPPPGFHDDSKVVWRLQRTLYGLKQASKAWYDTLRKTFESLGFTRSKADHSLFYKDEDSDLLIVAIYVDDKLIFSKNLDAIKHLKLQLSEHFEITDLGEACWILGMEVVHDRQQGIISLSQRHYVKTILDRFGLKDGRSVSTPLETNAKLVKIDVPEVDTKTYQSALGGLMYAMLATRPDLAYAVGVLSKHAACPRQAHFAALKRVYRYLCGTTDTRLIYRKTSEMSLLGYIDMDWAGDVNDRCSISGYTFVTAGAAISWSSKQPSVALSSTEAEYMAAAAAAKEATWLKLLFSEIEPSLSCTPIKLLIDNQSAMSLAKNATFHDRKY